MATILLTGANGYIGRRLLPVLVFKGHDVICLVRDKRRMKLEEDLKDKVSILEADLMDRNSLLNLPIAIDVVYYLVHSMGSSTGNFMDMEQKAAENFVVSLSKTNVKQIIYLSGIVNDDHEKLSKHLLSRKNVEKVLGSTGIPLTILRAAIIIGSGSASFEIIRDLVEKLPVMVAPKWLQTKCQPIAIRNVIQYLEGVLLLEKSLDETFDIGGPDILSYKEMLRHFATIRGLKRYILSVPVLSPKISSYWLYFVTSTSFPLSQSLVESMVNEVTVQNNSIREIVKIELCTYDEAVKLAFDKISQNEVVSSWKDALASSKINTRLLEFVQIPNYGCFTDQRIKPFNKPIAEVLDNIWSIGGDRGWYYWGPLWKIRGFIDKLVGGVGLRRGRRSQKFLSAGDALDFWRVLVADLEEKRLLLYAEMKLPGEAWLEFRIVNQEGKNILIQTAKFRPKGLWGRLYWYVVFPFHAFIFDGMAERIIHFKEAPSIGGNEA